jgi:hypothetical protein
MKRVSCGSCLHCGEWGSGTDWFSYFTVALRSLSLERFVGREETFGMKAVKLKD